MADVPSKYKRAFLQLHEPRDKGKKMGPLIDTINFSFNPKELTVQRIADWKATATKKPQPPEYNGAKAGTVTVEMFLDASEGGQVKTTVDKLLAAVLPAKGTDDKQKPVAPYVALGWGKVTYVSCAVVNSVSAKYTRFDADGQPIRAVVTVTLQEVLPSVVQARTRRRAPSGAQSSHLVAGRRLPRVDRHQRVRRARTTGAPSPTPTASTTPSACGPAGACSSRTPRELVSAR